MFWAPCNESHFCAALLIVILLLLSLVVALLLLNVIAVSATAAVGHCNTVRPLILASP